MKTYNDVLIIWPVVIKKPTFDLVDKDTGDVKELTINEKYLITKAEKSESDFIKIKASMIGVTKHKKPIDRIGPVYIKDKIEYTIACFAECDYIPENINLGFNCKVVHTNGIPSYKWLVKNGYEAKNDGIFQLVQKL